MHFLFIPFYHYGEIIINFANFHPQAAPLF